MGGKLFITESISDLNPPPQGWLWLRPTESGLEIYSQDEGVWVLHAKLSLADHSHPIAPEITMDEELVAAITSHAALPDVHHPANVGITGTKTLGGYVFRFTNGLLTGFEPA